MCCIFPCCIFRVVFFYVIFSVLYFTCCILRDVFFRVIYFWVVFLCYIICVLLKSFHSLQQLLLIYVQKRFDQTLHLNLSFSLSVEDTGINVDMDDEHTDGNADTRTWSDVVIRGTMGGRKVQP